MNNEKCPKCNAPQAAGSIECRKCGVIYSKAEKAATAPNISKAQKKRKFSYKNATIAATVIFVSFFLFSYYGSHEDSGAINAVILSSVALNDYEEAKLDIENMYKIRQDRPVLYLYWNMYVESCKAGNCMDLMFDVNFMQSNEITAYSVAQKFTKDRLKAPATASFEEKNNLADSGEIGDQYSFSYTVDSENSYGAMLRLNCITSVQNVGEASWILGTLDCD